MADINVLNKANNLKPAEDYHLLRKEGISYIEKMAGNIWTDYNTHDPGITLLEALCFAITDLSYRTGFEMKDLVAPETLSADSWKQLFYTAKEILPGNPVTINDIRKMLIDIKGVRNAWITISSDCEVPIYIDYAAAALEFVKLEEYLADTAIPKTKPKPEICEGENKIKIPLKYDPPGKIVELNGLYKIIIEFEKDVIDKQHKDQLLKKVLKKLHKHRPLCEDYLSVTAAEYRDFSLATDVVISDDADPEMLLAEICFRIENYFTPGIKFYTLEELLEMGKYAEDIFEGPFLKHGFILDEELEKNDIFRDMHLSDIINSVADIEGVVALRSFNVNDELFGEDDKDDSCGSAKYFDEWIAGMKREKLVGRLNIAAVIETINIKDETKALVKLYKTNERVKINIDRFNKLLDDLRKFDRNKKLMGHNNDFPVPVGDWLNIKQFYPVQYTLPETYKVGEFGLPYSEGNSRLVQALQLKGYLAVFEQIFLDFVGQLGSINELFSFKEIGKTIFAQPIVHQSENDNSKLEEEIIGYLDLYLNCERYIKDQQNIAEEGNVDLNYKCYIKDQQQVTEHKNVFEIRRNRMLNHLLARFSEEMNEYGSLMKFLYPKNYFEKLIKNKTDLLSDYIEISNNRGKAYNYKLKEEGEDDLGSHDDEKKIGENVSGVVRRVSRLIGLADWRRKLITPQNFLFVEKEGTTQGKIKLFEDDEHETLLLESDMIEHTCEDEIMHCFIESGCCENNFIMYPEQKELIRRKKNYSNRDYGFVLIDEDKTVIAVSPPYKTEKERNKARESAINALKKICDNEGMHMIEHILLRPRGDDSVVINDARLAPSGIQPDPVKYELLDVCLDECDLNVGVNNTIPVWYKFDIKLLKGAECIDNKKWEVSLKRVVNVDNPTGSKNQVIFTKTFTKYGKLDKVPSRYGLDQLSASEFISILREYGSELDNFKVYKTIATATTPSQYYFKLFDEEGNIVIESEIKYFDFVTPTDSTVTPPVKTETSITTRSKFKKKDVKELDPGDEIEMVDSTATKEVLREIETLKAFFAYELDFYCCEDDCDHDEDPYSFRVSFALPCWPKRFRNKTFRSFVERTIQSEVPAHIHAKIYWLGIEQMRVFENAYTDWLIEMSCNDTPDFCYVNPFIDAVKDLKNCDEHCKEHGDV